MVIIGTVVLQSITARFIALRLGVAEPEAKGILIVGANAPAREIAKALRECGFNVLVADADWNHIRTASMDGLDTYYGNVVSEHADHHLDLMNNIIFNVFSRTLSKILSRYSQLSRMARLNFSQWTTEYRPSLTGW